MKPVDLGGEERKEMDYSPKPLTKRGDCREGLDQLAELIKAPRPNKEVSHRMADTRELLLKESVKGTPEEPGVPNSPASKGPQMHRKGQIGAFRSPSGVDYDQLRE